MRVTRMPGGEALARRDLRIGGVTVRVWSTQSPDPTPLSTPAPPPTPGPARSYVLVHGIGMSHRYLKRLHRALAARGSQGSRVYSVDLPGFGGLRRPDHDLDVTDMGAVLSATLECLGIDAAVLVGQSMGTQWVIACAAAHPARAEAVVLIGPVADERHRTVGAQALALTLDTLRETPGANALVFTDYLRCGIRWYTTQLRHMLAYRLEDAVAQVRAPVLVVRGGRDPIAGAAWARRVVRAATSAPFARLAVVPRHAHNAQHSAPQAVAAAIETFCTDAAVGGAAGTSAVPR